jgi:hypothetical protein
MSPPLGDEGIQFYTHVINVVVLVVKIIIQLTYGIHGFKKKKHTTTIVYLMAMPEPQESSRGQGIRFIVIFVI